MLIIKYNNYNYYIYNIFIYIIIKYINNLKSISYYFFVILPWNSLPWSLLETFVFISHYIDWFNEYLIKCVKNKGIDRTVHIREKNMSCNQNKKRKYKLLIYICVCVYILINKYSLILLLLVIV